MEEEKKKVKENEEENLKLKAGHGKVKLLTFVLIIAAVIMIGSGVLLFLNKDNGQNSNNESQSNNQSHNPALGPASQENLTEIIIKDNISIDAFSYDVLLDTNGDVYVDYKGANDNLSEDELKSLYELLLTYSYYGKTGKLVKLNVQNIVSIKALDYGNGGDKYILLLDNNNKLYGLISYKLAGGNITILTDEKLNNVKKVYNDCDESACMVYADAIINGKEQKISLSSIFEKDEAIK